MEPVHEQRADEVHGEEAGPADLGGEAVGEAGEPGAEHGEEAGAVQVGADGQPGAAQPTITPDGDAEADLSEPELDPSEARGVPGPGLQDADGQEDRDRVVEARLGLEERPQPFGHRGAPEDAHHRRSVGRRDHGAEEPGGGAGDVEDQHRRPRHDRGGDGDADGGQQHGRRPRRADGPPRRVSPPSNRIRTSAAIETDWASSASSKVTMPEPVVGHDHPEHQEHQRLGTRTRPASPAVSHPDHDDGGAGEHQVVDREVQLHPPRLAGLDATGPAVRRARGSGAEENRTPDLFHAMEALYQLSYSPVGAVT